MGKFKFDLKDIFRKRLMLYHYGMLTPEAKEVVDYTIKESLKCNSVLRVVGFFKSRKLAPLKSDLWNISWSDRIELSEAVNENNIFDIIRIIYGISEKQFNRLELYNAFAVHKYILEELKQMVEVEQNELAHEYSEEEKDAGVEELQEFGYYNSLDSFTGGNILVQNDWLNLPYSKVFRKMCLDKKRYDININMKQNANRKTKASNS